MVTKVGQLYVGPQPQYFIHLVRYECLLDELKLASNLLIRTLQIDPSVKVLQNTCSDELAKPKETALASGGWGRRMCIRFIDVRRVGRSRHAHIIR